MRTVWFHLNFAPQFYPRLWRRCFCYSLGTHLHCEPKVDSCRPRTAICCSLFKPRSTQDQVRVVRDFDEIKLGCSELVISRNIQEVLFLGADCTASSPFHCGAMFLSRPLLQSRTDTRWCGVGTWY